MLSFILFIIVASYLYGRFWSGLNGIPGPELAKWTRFWRFYDVWKGDAHHTAIGLHKRFGSLVRIGPKHVSVSDPKEILNIYGLKGGFLKVSTDRVVYRDSFVTNPSSVDRVLSHTEYLMAEGAADEPLLNPRRHLPPRSETPSSRCIQSRISTSKRRCYRFMLRHIHANTTSACGT